MSVFTEAEREYLTKQPLMRFATASPQGRPDVAPVVFGLEGDAIVTSGFDVTRTVRYRNIQVNPLATVVIDDLATTDPWTPRGIKVIGDATIEQAGGSPRFRITARVIISWGINDTSPCIPVMERREVAPRADVPRQ